MPNPARSGRPPVGRDQEGPAMGRAENEAVARQVNEAFERHDFERLNALVADDVVWHQIGAPDLRGKAALQAAPRPGSSADYDITGRAHDILASEDHAIVL